MSEYPYNLEVDTNHRSASVVQVESLGRGGFAAILLSLLAVLFVACWAVSRAERAYERAEAGEKRAVDMAFMAEREARIAQDKLGYLQNELAKRGINITIDGH